MFEELEVLTELPHVRYLHLWALRKLTSMDFISQMTKLEGLFLEAIGTMTRFPELRKLSELRIVKLAGMTKLRDYGTLEHAPALEELVHQKADQQRPEDFLPVLRNRTLKRGGFGFHKRAEVKRMTALIETAGIDGQVYMYPQVRGNFAG